MLRPKTVLNPTGESASCRGGTRSPQISKQGSSNFPTLEMCPRKKEVALEPSQEVIVHIKSEPGQEKQKQDLSAQVQVSVNTEGMRSYWEGESPQVEDPFRKLFMHHGIVLGMCLQHSSSALFCAWSHPKGLNLKASTQVLKIKNTQTLSILGPKQLPAAAMPTCWALSPEGNPRVLSGLQHSGQMGHHRFGFQRLRRLDIWGSELTLLVHQVPLKWLQGKWVRGYSPTRQLFIDQGGTELPFSWVSTYSASTDAESDEGLKALSLGYFGFVCVITSQFPCIRKELLMQAVSLRHNLDEKWRALENQQRHLRWYQRTSRQSQGSQECYISRFAFPLSNSLDVGTWAIKMFLLLVYFQMGCGGVPLDQRGDIVIQEPTE